MSRKRYISTDISTDVKLAELAEHGVLPLLLYTWAIPHMDDWGRMTGDARQFKLLVCPALDVTVKDVDKAIDQIAEVGLWERYEAEGKKCIAIPSDRWFKHQSYISKAKREEDNGSMFPAPEKHRRTPQNAEEQQRVPNNTEEQREEPQNAVSFSPSFSVSPTPTPSRDNPPCIPPKGGQEKRQYADYVFLTEDEYQKLTELLGEDERDRYFLEYAAWISGQTARVQKSRSAYLTILNWHRRSREGQTKNKASPSEQKSRWQRKMDRFRELYEQAEAEEREEARNY